MTYRNSTAPLTLSAMIALASAAPAMAEGVDAGTLIENTASASYNVGGAAGSVNSNTVEVLVDELLDVAVASQDAGQVASPGSAVLTFSVTNIGNGPEAFTLTADPAIAGNDYDVVVDDIAIDSNGNGVYDEGVDAIIPAGGATPIIDADSQLTVFVLVTNPTGVSDGDSSQVNLLAEAVTGTGTPGTVFAGQGEGGGDAVAGATSADDDALGGTIASVMAVELAKTATIADPFGGTEAVPGAIVTYSLVATVSGSGSITDLRITDPIPTGTTYVADSLTLDGLAQTDAADTDAGRASASGIEVLVGNAAGSSTHTVTFNVEID